MFNFYERPNFIPEDLINLPSEFPWSGAQAHVGAVETLTPQLKMLGRCTGQAQIALCAGVLLWSAWRLKKSAEVDHNLELAEAAFAYTFDWRYVDVEAGPKGEVPDQPPALSASKKINSLMCQAMDYDRNWHSFYTQVGSTDHSANIIRYTLSEKHKKTFKVWLDSVAERAHRYFPLPNIEYRKFQTFSTEDAYNEFVAPRRGGAVPPQLIDPAFDYKPEDQEKYLAEFLENLNLNKNRYLRQPEEMIALGFTGIPYKLS